jgi:hypothetical protein
MLAYSTTNLRSVKCGMRRGGEACWEGMQPCPHTGGWVGNEMRATVVAVARKRAKWVTQACAHTMGHVEGDVWRGHTQGGMEGGRPAGAHAWEARQCTQRGGIGRWVLVDSVSSGTYTVGGVHGFRGGRDVVSSNSIAILVTHLPNLVGFFPQFSSSWALPWGIHPSFESKD